MSAPIFQIEDLIHRYHHRPVLSVERLDVEPASIVGLVGPNGSGKSTLLNLLGFIMRPTEGRILFDGQPAAPFDPSVRFQVTLLTQEPYLMKRSVYKNIVYGLKVRGDTRRLTHAVQNALTMVGLDPDRFSRRRWDELSGGEAQRVALAARLVLKPRVLLLDEPTASVDAASSELIRTAALGARSEWGTTLVIASHDRDWLHDICDDVTHLFEGQAIGTGRSNMVFGPWVPVERGRFVKLLADGRRLTVSAPPDPAATAFIDPAAIRILGEGETVSQVDTVCVDGLVTRLSLQRQTGDLFADVRVGALTLVVQVDESRLAAMTLHRGWPVTLAYRPDRIRWH